MTVRRVIDARTEPVTITTVPVSRSAVELYRPPAQTVPTFPPPAVSRQAPRRAGAVIAGGLAAVVLSAVAVGGFALGLSGWGVSELLTAGGTVLALVLALFIAISVAGRSAGHCPGAWHR